MAKGAKTGGRQAGTRNKLTTAHKRTIAEMAEEYSAEALRTLAAIMKSTKAPAAARATAANSLLDRAYGKPSQLMEHGVTTSLEALILQSLGAKE